MVSSVTFGFRQRTMPTTWVGSAGSATSEAATSVGAGDMGAFAGAAFACGGAPPQAKLHAVAAPHRTARRATVTTPRFWIIGPIYPYSRVLASGRSRRLCVRARRSRATLTGQKVGAERKRRFHE